MISNLPERDGDFVECALSGGVDRRAFLRGGLGLSLLPILPQPRGGQPAAKAEAVIQIFLAGGLSQLDSFDPKPHAPVEYKGEFGVRPTKIDGEFFSDRLPRLAGIADRLCVVRSMTHSEAAHERGTHNMLTGYRPSPAITYPSMGAVVSHKLGSQKSLPAYVTIPNANEIFLGTGYLSAANAPFTPGSDPNRAGFRVRDLNLQRGVARDRLERRKKILAELDEGFAADDDAVRATKRFYEQAYDLIGAKQARDAFRIDLEKKATRDAYGRTGIGQRLLLARRLSEAGVRYQVAIDGGYDNHQRIFPTLGRRLAELDRALSALLRDLEQRGRLDKTLVMLTSEFGRTPRVNRDVGRDHWPRCFSVVLAGGGIKGGVVHGATNEVGSEVDRDPTSPADIAATAFHLLGIDPTERLLSPGNRPIDIVRDGRVLKELLV